MPTPRFPFRHAALCVCLAWMHGCSSARSTEPHTVQSADELSTPLTPDAAAARAVEVSARVRAAALRLEASTRRAQSAAMPPDPSIALALGVPIDGLGGTPISVSILEGIGWILRHDAIQDAAERERSLAARELVASTVEVAAEARRLARALDSARIAAESLDIAARERAAALDIERSAADLRESTPARIRLLEREANDARSEAVEAALTAHELEVALASLLSVGGIAEIEVREFAPTVPEGAAYSSLEVIRARARLARAEAMLAAAESPLGSDARVGAAFNRDLEDRESVGGSIELALPVFRRPHDLAALRADVEAERAELADAERIALLETDHARVRVASAAEQTELARRSWRSAQHAQEIAENAHAEGESSRATLTEARAAAATARARLFQRQLELANALAALESRPLEATR